MSFWGENYSKKFAPQLEPLGVNTELDKTKLVQSKKAGERKAVKKAYEEVMIFRVKYLNYNERSLI